MSFEVIKCPSEEKGLTNKVYFNTNQFNDSLKYFLICTPVGEFTFKGEPDNNIQANCIATNLFQRKWADITLNSKVTIRPANLNLGQNSIAEVNLEIDVYSKKTAVGEPLNTDEMAREFGMVFCNTPLSSGQQLLFVFKNKRFSIMVNDIHSMSLDSGTRSKADVGIISTNSCIIFEKTRESQLMLVGKSTKSSGSNFIQQSIISPNWDFNQLGIGGLDKEFSAIFRRTFASRMFPPEIAKQLGLKHVRGILLYGPPGTGKTLMARQIGKMLNSREPKIVNGPSILDKYVGESEANIRKLFADAEDEAKKMGAYSALHIIIFDEIDAICKQRGSAAGSSGVHDTVVNQLLTKMDGVEELNNILVIGMTNRKDMIDEALLRPGRFEMQMEISLPDEAGRLQIIKIHTSKIMETGKLDPDVNLEELAAKTKNFSGAEIEGLVRSATNTAMYQLVKPNSKSQLQEDAFDKLSIKRSDFIYALENDIKPMFGTEEEELSFYAPRGIFNWDVSVTKALDMGKLAVKSVAEADVESYRPLTLLLEGPAKTGKTALAIEIAKKSGFPFIKICTTHKMTGFSENAKCQAMKKIFDDAAKSSLSVVILDNIEALIEYNPVGPRFSNYMVQVIKDLISMPLKKGRRMLVIGTTSFYFSLSEQNLCQAFTWTIHVDYIRNAAQMVNVLEEDDRLNSKEISDIKSEVSKAKIKIGIKHLIDLIDLVSKVGGENITDPNSRVNYFINRLREEGSLSDQN